jgi:hypothetical protein
MLKKIMMASALMILSLSVSAEIITHGNLQTDTEGSIIADIVEGREYMRFDEFDLTYQQTVDAVGVGGIYEDWFLADKFNMNDFFFALFESDVCSVEAGECRNLPGWNAGDFGATYGLNTGYTYISFLSGGSIPDKELGLFLINENNDSAKENDWSSPQSLDSFSGINLVLYREAPQHIGGINANAGATASVPLPATSLLFGLSVLGFGLSRRKSK